MKKLLLALACAILSLQAYSQASNSLWSTKIRKTCFYGIAFSPVPIYEIAASDAPKVGMVSIYDSVNFIHQMNGYWYVLTHKGGNGYVKDLRYRPIDLDSIKNAEKYRLLAIQKAKEEAARDSAIAAERELLAYTTFDSATAQQLLLSKLWEGMTPDMVHVSIGEPVHSLSPMANGSSFETWEYKQKCLYFRDGCLEAFEDIEEVELPEDEEDDYYNDDNDNGGSAISYDQQRSEIAGQQEKSAGKGAAPEDFNSSTSEPEADPKPEIASQVETEPIPLSEPDWIPAPEPEPVSETELDTAIEPEPVPEMEQEVEIETVPEPAPDQEVVNEPDPDNATETESATEPVDETDTLPQSGLGW